MAQAGTVLHLIAGHRIPLGTVRVAVGQAQVVSVVVGQVSSPKVARGNREKTIPEKGVQQVGRGIRAIYIYIYIFEKSAVKKE